MGFYSVTTGNNTLAADINQYASAFDGSSAIELLISGGTPGSGGTLGGAAPLNVYWASAPSADATLGAFDVNGDTAARLQLYIRGSDGYAGVKTGAGTGITGHLYGQSGGWKIDESLTVGTNLSVSGSAFLNSLNTTGNATVGNALTVTNGVTAASYGLSGGGTVWDSNNDGAGSGLDADTIHTLAFSDLVQAYNSSHTPLRIGIGHTLPTSGMAKWDVFFVTTFS